MGILTLEEQAAPSTPSANKVVIYPKSDGFIYAKDDAGTESQLSGITAATQAEQETGTSTTAFVSPGRQQFHQSAAKFWINFTGTGTIATNASYNVTSITDNGTGDYTVTIATDFSTAEWCCMVSGASSSGSANNALVGSVLSSAILAGSVRVFFNRSSGAMDTDPVRVFVAGWGDQ